MQQYPTSSTIQPEEEFKNLKLSGDAGRHDDMDMCLIRIGAPTPVQILPKNRARVKLICPNAFSQPTCPDDPIIWKCSECKDVVEYGIETKYFYCKCGQSNPNESGYRCNEKTHGTRYLEFPGKLLNEELSRHRRPKETTILILGETGVGKSTWINGLVNYLYFNDMYEALQSDEFHVQIPSKFTFIQRGKEKVIEVGECDTNEVMEAGKSATKEPRAYKCYRGEDVVRLIDTPGIGDSGGIQQDKENFDSILAYLTHYDEINAVCILLKPNNSRLTAMFRFCIQELLAHLHSSTRRNIVFCFTNARATFYEPGDTLPALNAELQKNKVGFSATPDNYFCFDNEPFRFLACCKNEIEFADGDVKTYAASWDRSVEETNRLFDHIDKLEPHKVRDTLSMNEARRIIVQMSKPLAEVAKTIQQNVQFGIEAKRVIDLVDKDLNALQKELKFKGYDLVYSRLPYPRTVCADSSCVKNVLMGQDRVRKTVYSQICHRHCSISGVPTETVNDRRLQRCWCIDRNSDTCHQCGHHYTKHMHITYDLTMTEKDFLHPKVQSDIRKKKCAKEGKEAFKQAIDDKNRELKVEQEIIVRTSAKYGSFLNAHALIPYNDAVGDYLDMSIQLERNKPNEIRDDELVKKMKDMKCHYEEERRILDNALHNQNGEATGGANINTPEEVMQLQDVLFGLKHTGKNLKAIFDGISIASSSNNIAFQERSAPIRQRRVSNRHVRSPGYVFRRFTTGVSNWWNGK